MRQNILSGDFISFLDRNPQVKVVCFDYFDTLVYRTIEPEHTKQIAARQLASFMKNGLTGREIYQWRFDLEANLCRKNAERGLDLEFRITDFASEFYGLLNHEFSELPDFLTREVFQELFLSVEIHVETSVQRVFDDMKAVLQEVRGRGYTTAIVSDFYIPSEIFQKFLSHHGWIEAFDQIFVSCDFGVTKGSGRLYEKVVEGLACPVEHILMVGDNEHSDVHMASAAGLLTYRVDRSEQKERYQQWLLEQQSPDRQQQKLRDRMTVVVKERGGDIFPEMALTLWRFTQRLFQRLIRDNVRDVFFFSKEGEFLQKLFDRYQEGQFGCRIIRSHYLLVSRKSTFVCSLKPLREENFSRLFYQYRDISPREFLLSLNFSERRARELCERIGIDCGRRHPNFGITDTFAALVGSPIFAEWYEAHRSSQRTNLLRYLHSFDVDIRTQPLSIVDVGWKGSIQDNLFFALDQKARLNGYYLGLLQPTNVGENNRKTGILFSDTPVETPFLEVYNSNRSLFEMLLTATHGSADGYFATEQLHGAWGKDFSEDGGHFKNCGGIQVRTLDLPEERKLYEENIRPIQDQFLSVVTELDRTTLASTAPIPGNKWFARHQARMMFEPRDAEIDFFESLYHLENFGIFEFTDFRTSRSPSAEDRRENLEKLRQDPEAVYQAGIWAPVALKRLGIEKHISWYGRHRLRAIFAEKSIFRRLLDGDAIGRALHRLQPNRRVDIVFFLGSPDINGGTYVIFEHAVRLQDRGYNIFILTEEPVEPRRYAWHPEAGRLQWITFQETAGRKFEYAVATWWRSAFLLRQVAAETYLYFIQSIETRFFPPEERSTYVEMIGKRLAERSYTLPLPMITEARWIQRYLSDNFGSEAHVVPNGIRKDIYRPSGSAHAKRDPDILRVLVEGPLNVRYKNVERTVELCRRSEVDEIWLLTSSDVDTLQGADRIFSRVPIWDTPAIYRSCDVLVKLSYVEGMFGPPLEMFHCGGTAIVYNVTGHDEYIRDGENSMVVQTDDEDAVIEALHRLKREPETLKRLKEGALETAARWPDWDAASLAFERAMRDSYRKYPSSQAYLNRMTDQLWRFACEKVEEANLFMAYRGERTAPQFCQIFWHFGEGFTETASEKLEYESGRWASIQKSLIVPGGTVHLRIDPSLQVGVGHLEQVLVRDHKNGRLLLTASAANEWAGIEIAGTADPLEDHDSSSLMIKAYEEDPQFLLPPLELGEEKAEIGIEITLKFLPFPLTVGDLLQSFGHRLDGPPVSLGEAIIDRH